MPLKLPNLDDLSWEQLVREGRSLIPAYAPDWTNHNTADPGITLIELLAYLSELLIYRLNVVSKANLREFLNLLHGPGWPKRARNLHAREIDNEKRLVISTLRRLHRAVTTTDFETLSLAVNEELDWDSGEHVEQVRCLPEVNLVQPSVPFEKAAAPGHVSVVLLSDDRDEPSEDLRRRVRDVLEQARLLTTWIHVVPPSYLDLSVQLKVTVTSGTDPEKARADVVEKLADFFDSHDGGPRGKGWPFGRSVFVSELYALLTGLPGIALVSTAVDETSRQPLDELVIDPRLKAREIRNQRGEVEAVSLMPNELVRFRLDRSQITTVRNDDDWERGAA